MDLMTVAQLRAEAKKQLLNYRKNKPRAHRALAKTPNRKTARGWVGAIDCARAYFSVVSPAKERFMCRMFGLETPIPRNLPTRERMIKLSLDLSVGESTLYKWREDILEIVLYAAIEAGLISPFGIRRSKRNGRKKAKNKANGELMVSNAAND
jgi:hypothetical protein